jgi:hypothetical protein
MWFPYSDFDNLILLDCAHDVYRIDCPYVRDTARKQKDSREQIVGVGRDQTDQKKVMEGVANFQHLMSSFAKLHCTIGIRCVVRIGL